MTDSFKHSIRNETPQNDCSQVRDELSDLRSLLVGTEIQELEDLLDSNSTHAAQSDHSTIEEGLHELRDLLLGSDLHKRLNSPKVLPEDISLVLPEAIMLRSLQDQHLGEAMVPTVEQAIQSSVKQDFTILSDAIYPVIGPSIRKAIATALEATIESLNQTVEHSLSPQSFKWRLEAIQTGKSFAEVVVLRTLLFRVEQVFLIHKDTGLMLQHVVRKAVAPQDADLVSAMLTAIQNFVQDSFSVQKGDTLDTLHFGDLTIWIEQGPQAVLAGVIRGHPPKELKLVFQDASEKIHLKLSPALSSFRGDISPFQASKPYLESCLQAQFKPKKRKPSPGMWIFLSSLLIALGIWSFLGIQEKQRWTAYLAKLKTQQGIVVVNAERKNGKYFISGLRDPLAIDPIAIAKQVNLDPKTIISRWEPYRSLYPEMIAARAKQILQPPKTVSIKLDENGILYVTGSAPHQWIMGTQKLVRAIPEITKFQDANLSDTDLTTFNSSKEQIQKQIILFAKGTSKLTPSQDNKIQKLVTQIPKISDSAKALGKNVYIEIIGRADNEGSEEINMTISKARANEVLSTLTSKGLKQIKVSTVGVGTKQPLIINSAAQKQAFNRSVSLKVILTDSLK